jgi:hypothetical protein
LVQFSQHQQSSSSSFLSFGRLCVILHYQRDVLLMGTKFGQQNGVYVYFVDRIKRNLRRSQLVFTEIGVDFPENTWDIGRYYLNNNILFKFNVSLLLMLTFSKSDVSRTHLKCKREAEENVLCTLYKVSFVINRSQPNVLSPHSFVPPNVHTPNLIYILLIPWLLL